MHTPAESPTAPAGPATPRPKWHLVYYLLAAFDVITICTTLFLTHQIIENYSAAIATNRVWTAALDRSAELAKLAGAVNAPGNDVFETHDVQTESLRMATARHEFDDAIAATRVQLRNPSTSQGTPIEIDGLLRALARVEASMNEMTGEAARIFKHFDQGRADLAGTRMATMDRRYAAVNAAVAAFNTDVRKIQDRLFDVEQATAARVQKFEWLVAGFVLLIVTGVTVYGRRITTEMTRAAGEREAHLLAMGRLAGDLATARDAALASSRAKSAFLGTMSHELRTPLNGVLGMTTLLLDTPLDDEQRELAATARDCGVSLLGLLDDVLEYSRAEGGCMRGPAVAFDAGRLGQDVIQSLQREAAGKRLGLHLYVSPELPIALGGDPPRIRQVLLHLVGNAIKFSEHGDVTLRIEAVPAVSSASRSGESWVRFEVRDTGAGIPPAVQAHLFEPFVQADSSATRRHGGAGMGLALCQRLVRLMGGHLSFTSELGCGSCFTFVLPLDGCTSATTTSRANGERAA